MVRSLHHLFHCDLIWGSCRKNELSCNVRDLVKVTTLTLCSLLLIERLRSCPPRVYFRWLDPRLAICNWLRSFLLFILVARRTMKRKYLSRQGNSILGVIIFLFLDDKLTKSTVLCASCYLERILFSFHRGCPSVLSVPRARFECYLISRLKGQFSYSNMPNAGARAVNLHWHWRRPQLYFLSSAHMHGRRLKWMRKTRKSTQNSLSLYCLLGKSKFNRLGVSTIESRLRCGLLVRSVVQYDFDT